MEKQFKVGQVWRTRDGGTATIESMDESTTYSINSSIDCHTIDGRQWDGAESDGDLIELISEAPSEEPAAPAPKPEAPAAPKFVVGQRWKRRDGSHASITLVLDNDSVTFPIQDSECQLYTAAGRYHSTAGLDSHLDLVELAVSQPEPEKSATPEFAVGQVWACRDGRTVRVEEAEPSSYSGELVVKCEDGHWRRRSGRISDVNESPRDLVQQLPFDEPSAPAIADAMLADAVALAPQHDAEAVGEPLPAIDLDLDPNAGTVRQPASEEECALFDALVVRTVDRYGIDALPGNLDAIKQVIAARRAL